MVGNTEVIIVPRSARNGVIGNFKRTHLKVIASQGRSGCRSAECSPLLVAIRAALSIACASVGPTVGPLRVQ